MIYRKFYCILTILFLTGLYSQSLLKINSADILKQDPAGGKIIYGNVDIEYDIYKVKCDSAVINENMTSAKLFKNIQFSDTSRTIFAHRATLSKTHGGRLAFLRGDIIISEKDLYITGNEASLNELDNRITVADSVTARYYEHPSALFCKKLMYSTKDETFSSSTVDSVLYIDSLRYYKLHTKVLLYNSRTQKLDIRQKFRILAREFAEPFYSFKDIDPAKIDEHAKDLETEKKAVFSADQGIFFFDPLDIQTNSNCRFRQKDTAEKDTIFFDADNMDYSERNGKGRADGGINIRHGELRIISGSAEYYEDKNILKFHNDPEITYRHHTITGDSVKLNILPDDPFPEKGTVYGRPLYTSVPNKNFPEEMNMLKGKLMDIWFTDKQISKIIVSKEAESLYFAREDDDGPSNGSNYLLGERLTISFKNGEIENAAIEGGCEGSYFPERLKLKGVKKIRK
ncbi:MAG: hypothetical protein R6V47_07135 [Candidatus Delongbacteria bacterium]